jgi:hypothetical protein
MLPVAAVALTLGLSGMTGVYAAPVPQAVGATVSAAFAPDGALWRATPMKDGVLVDRSTDLGRTFGTPARVSRKGERIRAQPEDRPQIAIDRDGNVFVIYAADARQPWTRFITVSTDRGRSFSTPAAISAAPERMIQYQPALQARADSGIDLFWIEEDSRGDAGRRGGVMHYRRVDRDRTGPDLILHDAMCECCRLAPAALPDGTALLLARLLIDGRIRDPGLIGVRADGSIRPARAVTADHWQIDACPESGPALAVSASGRQHMSWFTQGSRRQGLFYAWSDDNGTTLSAPIPIGMAGAMPAHSHLAASGRNVVLAWQQYDGRETSVHVMTSDDDGASWSVPRQVGTTGSAADYPFVLTYGGRFYVSWYTGDAGYRLVPLAGADGG